jgi:hypothetical protein
VQIASIVCQTGRAFAAQAHGVIGCKRCPQHICVLLIQISVTYAEQQ